MSRGLRLAGRGLLRAMAIIVGVATLCWCLVEAAPGSAAERAARARGVLPAIDAPGRERVSREVLDEMRELHGLDRGLGARVVGYVAGLARGDLGRSWRDDEPVAALVAARAPTSLALVAVALALAIFGGTWLARVQVVRRGRARGARSAATLALALPPVWLGILVLSWWSPAPGGGAAFVAAVGCLALAPAAVVYRHLRVALAEGASAPWAQTLRAQGLDEGRVIGVYALKLARPLRAVLAVNVSSYLLGATIVVERIFGFHGLGDLLLDASVRGDAPVIVGIAVIFGALLALALTLADVVRHHSEATAGGRDG